ncbi:pyridoxamine 5'-phosphate oxidase family protein [Spirulina sp. CS-785/01]|uniref:Npun_F5749 family FMN-dependent PPOX-type flavoprotein n=1 Tax=Spirulina sp. CS-785/01 TaxID=3021716 RepID=UPI0023306E58|nr:Npun_F5749 family FMN-dependent PPOX-type flavoprotein [Spirulina sp. CS-785/01]MDB9312002.1 pyridoxamine 5'-phosphate oxidase family protein [Spirulina sp. CS-785/01]
MNLAPWRSILARSLYKSRNLRESRYFQLATVTPEGYPKNRTVVFRDFLEQSNQIKIITDSRSEKIEQIEAKNWGEICWYFSKTREQFRMGGELTLVGASYPDEDLQKARLQTWQNISDAARMQFAWPTPKTARVEDTEPFSSPTPDPTMPLDTFILVLLNPQVVDYLTLRGNPQNRTIYRLTGEEVWEVQEVNP